MQAPLSCLSGPFWGAESSSAGSADGLLPLQPFALPPLPLLQPSGLSRAQVGPC